MVIVGISWHTHYNTVAWWHYSTKHQLYVHWTCPLLVDTLPHHVSTQTVYLLYITWVSSLDAYGSAKLLKFVSTNWQKISSIYMRSEFHSQFLEQAQWFGHMSPDPFPCDREEPGSETTYGLLLSSKERVLFQCSHCQVMKNNNHGLNCFNVTLVPRACWK